MRAPISVVIPTLDAAAVLPGCLGALVEGLEAGLIRELLVSDGGSRDDTCQIARDWGGEVLSGPASRGGQLQRGCAAAKGTWILVLHADTQLSPGWAEAARAHLASEKAGWFRLAFDEGGRGVAAWANLRAGWGLPYGDQGLLVPAALYVEVGGYPDIPLMEDVALVRALRGRLAPIAATAVTRGDKYRAQGWLRRGARNLWTLARYFAGVSPERLAQSYNRPVSQKGGGADG